MTVQDDAAAIAAFNPDSLPRNFIDKRVTELMDLTGKMAFVTGADGDGNGLGQAVANRLAGLGADVALIGRGFGKVDRRAKEIEQRWGVSAFPVKADMSDWHQVHEG